MYKTNLKHTSFDTYFVEPPGLDKDSGIHPLQNQPYLCYWEDPVFLSASPTHRKSTATTTTSVKINIRLILLEVVLTKCFVLKYFSGPLLYT